MATLSEDSNSWKASGIRRRDFRNAHNGPEINKKGRKKKDTKRWCRGRIGKEHNIQHQPHPTYGRYGCHVDLCVECGKELKTYWSPWIKVTPHQKCRVCNKSFHP